MDNPARTVPWWKKGMPLTQMAIYLGISLAFVLVGAGVSYLLERQAQTQTLSAPAMAIVSEPMRLDVDTPANVVDPNAGPIIITGTTLPYTVILVFTPNHSATGQGNSAGEFSIEIEAVEGTNNLTITAVTADGREMTTSREVYYKSTQE